MPKKRDPHPCCQCHRPTVHLLFCGPRCYQDRRLASVAARDAEILALYRTGMSRTAVAAQLGVSEFTVGRVGRRNGIHRKAGRKSKATPFCVDCGAPTVKTQRHRDPNRCQRDWRRHKAAMDRNSKRRRENIPPERWRLEAL